MAKKTKKTSPAPAAPKAKSKPLGGPMDPDLIERFLKLMSENDVSTLEVSEGANVVKLSRGGYAPAPTYVAAPATPVAAAAAPSASAAKPQAAPVVEDTSDLKPIKSPMVGTFYSAPSPDAKPFVQVGSVINEETDVCVIEAMKVFNNIKAEMRGTIAKVLVENGKTVEFGTVLFLVKP